MKNYKLLIESLIDFQEFKLINKSNFKMNKN
jgi:hypothetical protein